MTSWSDVFVSSLLISALVVFEQHFVCLTQMCEASSTCYLATQSKEWIVEHLSLFNMCMRRPYIRQLHELCPCRVYTVCMSSTFRLLIFRYAAIFRWMLSIKTCICLMMKWQLNVSRVDNVSFGVNLSTYSVALFTLSQKSYPRS